MDRVGEYAQTPPHFLNKYLKLASNFLNYHPKSLDKSLIELGFVYF
jgi:hypothetical protein